MAEPALFPHALVNVGRRYLLRHPTQTLLMVLGIALGVAVVVAIDVANTSASRAFDLSVDSITGKATHQIIAGPQGVDEDLYTQLRIGLAGLTMAPVISDTVTSPQLGARPLQLLGIDPFAEAPFRSYFGTDNIPIDSLAAFLTDPGAILISTDLADRYALTQGDTIIIEFSGQEFQGTIAGLLVPDDNLSRRTLSGMILADISTAQEITGRIGRLTSIDVIIPDDGTSIVDQVNSELPVGTRLVTVEGRTGTIEQMTAAFRTNLLALSLLALVVGLFLIYNAMTFSVVQRRPLLGTLRCLGATSQEVLFMILAEALIVGTVGAVLGILVGIIMGQGAVQLVTRTINDLFFVTSVRGIELPLISILKGAGLGLLGTLLAAVPPAWEASAVPPRTALMRSGLEEKAQRAVRYVTWLGLVVIASGCALLLIPSRSLVLSFAGTFAVLVGFSMLTPLSMRLFMQACSPLTGALFGPLGRMAPREVVKSLSRTSIAVAALMIAVSVTIGISLMVSSFRYTVIVWLEQTLQGDIYVSVPGGVQVQPTATIASEVVEILERWPGIRQIDTARVASVDSPIGPVNLSAINNPSEGEETLYIETAVPKELIWREVQTGEAVTVSEPFASRTGLGAGDLLTLNTDTGAQTFVIVGVYYDYGTVQGTVTMDDATYRRLWNDDQITAIALRLEDGVDPDALAVELQDALNPVQQLTIRPNRGLRNDVLAVFDQTFAITGALNLLATTVAFVGVLSALLSLELEKQREIGILRALGLTVNQLWGMTMLETGLMGIVAGLMAMPTGYVLALILVYVINRRSFGWTLQMQIAPGPFITALAITVSAALLAALYPAWRMGRMVTSDAIRFE